MLAPLVTTDPTPVCAGYLYKLGAAHRAPGSSAITRRWHRRWFALTKDHCLYHYKAEADPHPLGAVVLRGHTVHAFSTASRPYAFTVSLAGDLGLQLAAHTAEARGRWGHVITQAAEQAAQRDELLEASSRRVQQAPGTIAAPDCFGYLHKLGARWHQWKKRYCVLKDACLFLYHDTDATKAIGVVHLHGYRVQSTSIGGKKNAFELLPPEPKFRHFYFHTESDNDKKRWLAALEYSIDRWIKVG
uniref:Regulator of G-protein signaling 12 n=1 Tax=Hirondellea gigas TaxID=1518452 RepID=A0A6A7FQ84_9CRUS